MTRALVQAVVSWSLGVALLIVGSFTFLVELGGHSPGMRRGAQEPYLASMFPGLARRAGGPYGPYPNTRGDSAIFALTSATLLVVGLLLVV